jgi:hypothetical protein
MVPDLQGRAAHAVRHAAFRPGQQEAVEDALTIVVSPLVSRMAKQVAGAGRPRA